LSDLVQSRSCNVDVMHKGRHTFRKLDPLLLLALFVSLAVLITTAADAVEGAFKAPTPADLQDGDMQVARLGRHGPGVHLSLQAPRNGTQIYASGATEQPRTDVTPDLFINLRFPW
jgi:hypothetical protein